MSQIQVDNIYNKEATGSPSFPLGVNVTGVVTATTFKGGAEITSGTISATSVTAASGTFNGPVTIGGTLTYEDVTNIDSVGVITARNGLKVTASGIDIVGGGINAVGVVTATNDIKANGNIIGDNSTNISGVSSVTATTYYGSGASLSGIDAAPTVNGTASGSIAANKPVIVKSDGNFAQVNGSTPGEGSVITWLSGSGAPSDIRCAATPDGTTVAVLYKLVANSGLSYLRLGTTTQNQASTSVSWGTATLPNNNVISDTNEEHVLENIDNDRFLILYKRSGDLYAKIVTFSGNTPSFGTETSIGLPGSGQVDCCLMGAGSNKVFVATRNPSSYEYTFVLDCGSSGTTMTAGSNSSLGPTVEYPTPCWDPVNSQAIVAYRRGGDCQAIVYSVSGTSITAKSNFISTGGGMASHKPAIAFDTNVNKAIIVMSASNNKCWIFNGTPSAGSITWYSPSGTQGQPGSYNVDEDLYSMKLAYDPIAKKTSWIFNKNADNSPWASYITIVGDAPYWSPVSPFNRLTTDGAGGDQDLDVCILPSTLGGLTMWTFPKTSGGDEGRIIFEQVASTNMTSGNVIGFSDAAYTNGQTAKVKVTGNVTTQSGLTPGQKYYIQLTGTLGTTAADPSVVAGRALSATSLLIQPA